MCPYGLKPEVVSGVKMAAYRDTRSPEYAGRSGDIKAGSEAAGGGDAAVTAFLISLNSIIKDGGCPSAFISD
jgi:hypothetical protein